jgi:hypothetical protein
MLFSSTTLVLVTEKKLFCKPVLSLHSFSLCIRQLACNLQYVHLTDLQFVTETKFAAN